jgi:hypothetical protein
MWVGCQRHDPAALPPGGKPCTQCTGGFVGRKVSVDMRTNFRELQNIYLTTFRNYRSYSATNKGMRWVYPFPSSTTNFSRFIFGASKMQLRKAAISFMCVRTEQRNCQTTNVREILYLGIFLKLLMGLYKWRRTCSLWGVRWQSKRNNGLQTRRQIRWRRQSHHYCAKQCFPKFFCSRIPFVLEK